MTLQIDVYTDPGTYIGEVIVPGAVNVATNPFLLGILGAGSRVKTITNEAVQRGEVLGLGLTFYAPSGTGTGGSISAPVGGLQTMVDPAAAFTTQLLFDTVTIRNDPVPGNNGVFTIVDRPSPTSVVYSNPAGGASGSVPARTYAVTPSAVIGGLSTPIRTNRAIQTTTLFRDGKAVSESFFNFKQAYVESDLAGPFALVTGTNDAISIEMDGHVPLTLIFTSAAGATTVNGTQVTVRNSTIAVLATASLSEIVAAINEGLNPADSTANAAVTALGYGAPYASAAHIITATGFRLTSPVVGPAGDVRVSDPYVHTAVTTLFGSAGPINRDSPSVLDLQRVAFNSLSVYTLNFINILLAQDALANTGILDVVRIGTAPGIGTFTQSADFALASDHIDWSLGSAAAFQTTVPGTYNVSVNDTVRIGLDGKTPIDIKLNGLSPAPIGYANPGSPAAATPAEIANNINAVLAANANYGSRYKTVASTITIGASTYVRLQSIRTDSSSAITIATPSTAPADDATAIIFGLQSTQLPLTIVGTGKHPVPGAIYFVTYDINRPATDYNIQKRYFSEAQATADLGVANANNPLMIGVRIGFRQQVSSLVVVQVNDSALPGSPNRQEFDDALAATTNSDLITDMVILSTDLGTQLDLKDSIESESSPVNKHYRRGYWGMPINTPPGDMDTPNSFVYMASRTLQVAPDSPGRGRMILVAPPQPQSVSIDLTQADGSVERVHLDSTFLAVAAAAKQTSFTNPALSLASQTLGGFNIDDISLSSVWSPPQRRQMAQFGTMVVTFDAGNFKILDPCTTEQGNGGLAAFNYPSTSAQKDNISRKVDKALTANIVGVVPTDLSDFIVDIKLFISEVLQGEIGNKAIGPFTVSEQDKTPRRIDLQQDIEVEQDTTDPTKFFFRYFFNLRYPALRLFGEFSVDNPFFTTAQAA